MPSPKEYVIKRKIPCARVVSKDANAKIDPRIGPIQGVQPKANPIPTTRGK